MSPSRARATTPERAPAARLVLASGSPRRRDLLDRAGVAFAVRPADVDETPLENESPRAMVERLALAKARAVARRLGAAGGAGHPVWVLGADTTVVLDGEALGKPDDAAHAVELLSRLLGRRHSVWTGVALVAAGGPDAAHRFAVESRVFMATAPREEVEAYAAGGEPLDKAGAYAFQGDGRRFVDRVEGSETNVIGLPMDETLTWLRRLGVVGGEEPA